MIGFRNSIRSLFFLLLILPGTLSYGQKVKLKNLTTFDEKLLHFGFTLGINTLDFRVRNYLPISENLNFIPVNWQTDIKQVGPMDTVRADVANLIPGFTVAIVSDLRMTRDLSLRFLPGMSFGERKLTYNIPVVDNLYTFKDVQYTYSVKSRLSICLYW